MVSVGQNSTPKWVYIWRKSTTLGHFDGLLYEDVRLIGVVKWILPIGVFHRMHRRRGMQCCPLCLQQGVPFFSLKWRISLCTICEVHKCLLIDACPQCGATIEYHRLGIARGEFIPHSLTWQALLPGDLSNLSMSIAIILQQLSFSIPFKLYYQAVSSQN